MDNATLKAEGAIQISRAIQNSRGGRTGRDEPRHWHKEEPRTRCRPASRSSFFVLQRVDRVAADAKSKRAPLREGAPPTKRTNTKTNTTNYTRPSAGYESLTLGHLPADIPSTQLWIISRHRLLCIQLMLKLLRLTIRKYPGLIVLLRY